jgi:hypothetical protein
MTDNMIEDKRAKIRQYQNNYVKNRKAVDEEYRIRLQTRTNQYVKERYKNDEAYRLKINEQAKLRKRRLTEKNRMEKIDYYNMKIANFDMENGDMMEYFRMKMYIAKWTNSSTENSSDNSE